MHRRWIAAIVTAIVIAGCGTNDAKPAASGPSRLVSDDEIARFDADTTRRLTENVTRRCDRPVLHGAALPGPAGPDIAAFDRPVGNLAACIASLDELGKTDKLADRTPALLDFEQRCGIEFEGAIRKATAHRDACSPFQIGQPQPSTPLSLIRIAKIVGLRARLRAENHDVAGALWLILDAVRLYQDVSRGHATLLTSMIGTAAIDALLDHAHAILEADVPAQPAELAAAVDRLLATEPAFSDALAGNVDQMAVFSLAPLKPAGWVPRGGWPDGARPGKRPDGPIKFGDPRDDDAIALVVVDTQRAALAAACPADATLQACHVGLVQFGRAGAARAKGNTDVARLYQTLVAQALHEPDAEATRIKIRETIVDVLAGIATPAFDNFAEKRAAAFARLAALRLHLEVVRAARCPTAAELEAAPYAALRSPRLLGEAIGVAVASGALELTAPAWMKHSKMAWRIRCPK